MNPLDLWQRLKANVSKAIEDNRLMWHDGTAEVGRGNVIIAGANLTATKAGNQITLAATGVGGGGMEQHANEYHDPDMALATHNHLGEYDPIGTGDSEATAHVAAHSALDTGVHGATAGEDIENTGNRNAANGYAGLGDGGMLYSFQLGSGTPSATTFLRGDQTWAVPSAAAATKFVTYIVFGTEDQTYTV